MPKSRGRLIAQGRRDMTQDESKINIGCGVSGLEEGHNFDNSLTISVVPLILHRAGGRGGPKSKIGCGDGGTSKPGRSLSRNVAEFFP